MNKAQRLRKQTGDERYWAPFEKEHYGFVKRVENTLIRPFKILFTEPMLLAISLYMSVSVLSLCLSVHYLTPFIVHLRLYLPPIRSLSNRLHCGT